MAGLIFLVTSFTIRSQVNTNENNACNSVACLGNYKAGAIIPKDEFFKIAKLDVINSCNKALKYQVLSFKVVLIKNAAPILYGSNLSGIPKALQNAVSQMNEDAKLFFTNIKYKNAADSVVMLKEMPLDSITAIHPSGDKEKIKGLLFTIKIGNGPVKPKSVIKQEEKQKIEAKLLYGPKKNIPLSHHKVYLTSNKGDTLKKTETNDFGDFSFTDVNAGNSNIVIGKNDKLTNEEVYLAKQNGIIVSKFTKTSDGFTYKILPADIIKLNPITEEDTELKINNFAKSNNKTITIAENIYYTTNEFKLSAESKKKIDVIANTLRKNAGYKLEIYSHTDSKGEDAVNLALSNKRAVEVLEYLTSTGIDKGRLTAKGMGETQIMNRCINGEICSEKEHELNRRTEFKFIKN